MPAVPRILVSYDWPPAPLRIPPFPTGVLCRRPHKCARSLRPTRGILRVPKGLASPHPVFCHLLWSPVGSLVLGISAFPENLSSLRAFFDFSAVRSEEHTSELQSPDHLVC